MGSNDTAPSSPPQYHTAIRHAGGRVAQPRGGQPREQGDYSKVPRRAAFSGGGTRLPHRGQALVRTELSGAAGGRRVGQPREQYDRGSGGDP